MTQHIEMTPGVMGGRPRIHGTRIRVMDVVSWVVHAGASVDEFLEEFPRLTRADVHAALTFYYDNVDMIENEFELHSRVEQDFRRDYPHLVGNP